MEIRLASLTSDATDAAGTTVIIDVFRAFTTAAVALSGGARRIIMVDSLDKALALRSSGVGDYCIGERDSVKPPGSTSAIHRPSWNVPRWPSRR
jgi:2-phosphosulfolactate phosphatase